VDEACSEIVTKNLSLKWQIRYLRSATACNTGLIRSIEFCCVNIDSLCACVAEYYDDKSASENVALRCKV